MPFVRAAALLSLLLQFVAVSGQGRSFTVVELNAENVFDCAHDSLKDDAEFTPEGARHWTPARYWDKLNAIGREIVSCGEEGRDWAVPDLVALCEVENDTVMRDLTRRSLLGKARYEYVMTDSPDRRGIDVALLYSPFSFRMISSRSLRVPPLKGMKPARDILYVSGEMPSGDTLHVFVLHAPSRSGGERGTRKFRMHVVQALSVSIDSLRRVSPDALVMVLGDFNDHADDASVGYLCAAAGLENVSRNAKGTHGAEATYRYRGEWGSLDHILVSKSLLPSVVSCRLNDAPFLLEEDPKYGGVRPRRYFSGYRYNDGYSDHLPLVLTLVFR